MWPLVFQPSHDPSVACTRWTMANLQMGSIYQYCWVCICLVSAAAMAYIHQQNLINDRGRAGLAVHKCLCHFSFQAANLDSVLSTWRDNLAHDSRSCLNAVVYWISHLPILVFAAVSCCAPYLSCQSTARVLSSCLCCSCRRLATCLQVKLAYPVLLHPADSIEYHHLLCCR